MNTLFSFLHYIGIDDIFGILSLIGLASFLVRRFVLHKSPVPSGTFGKVSPELLRECVALLQKKEKGGYGEYTAPEEILTILKANPCNMDCLKDLLCDICAHVGIDGDFIELIVEDEPLPDRAGEISTDLAFTTIRLDIKPHHTVDGIRRHAGRVCTLLSEGGIYPSGGCEVYSGADEGTGEMTGNSLAEG